MADVVQPVFIALDLPLAAHQADSRAMTSLSDTNDAVATRDGFFPVAQDGTGSRSMRCSKRHPIV